MEGGIGWALGGEEGGGGETGGGGDSRVRTWRLACHVDGPS